jgi:hypothetical protein
MGGPECGAIPGDEVPHDAGLVSTPARMGECLEVRRQGTAVSPDQVFEDESPASGESGSGVGRIPGASLGIRCKALLLTVLLILVTLGVGWLAWSVVEWRHGRNPGYRLTNLRAVRRSDGRPIGFGRSLCRETCCALLLLPTLLACGVLALGFAMGASPSEGVFGQSRRAPWDVVTRTDVVNERRVG